MSRDDYTGEKTKYPPFPGFLNDANEVMFHRKLLRLKEQYRDKPLPGRPETLIWESYPIPEPDPTLIRASVAKGPEGSGDAKHRWKAPEVAPLYFRLAVMEYSPDHAMSLQTAPINYEVARVPGIGPEYRIAAGPAPTMEEAIRRAEALWLATFSGKATLPPLNPTNDLDGREIKRDLQRIRARALRRQPEPTMFAGLKWAPGGHVSGTVEIRSAMAEYAVPSGSYGFFVAEFGAEFVLPGEPTISWEIVRHSGKPGVEHEEVAQGAAPTFEEAMARCEAVFRVEINATLPPDKPK